MNYIKNHKRAVIFVFDLCLMLLSYVFVCVLLLKMHIPTGSNKVWQRCILTFFTNVVFYGIVFHVSGWYKNMLKYTGPGDLAKCALGCAVSYLAVIFTAMVFDGRFLNVIVIVLGCIITIAAVLMFRIFVKLIYCLPDIKKSKTADNKRTKEKKALIIGAGNAAVMLLDDILINHRRYKIVGMIDDKKTNKGDSIRGIEILGNRNDIIDVCEKYKVDEIFFSIPSINAADKSDILKICSKTGCRVRVLPGVAELVLGDGIYNNAKSVSIEDLLARDVIELDKTQIGEYVDGKTVLVTGGGGSIGSELCRQLARYNIKKLLVLDIYENNAYSLEQELRYRYPELNLEIIIASVRDKKRLDSIFKTKKPDIVFHAAAHKHVPLMEANPTEAVKNNVFGTYNCAVCAHENGVKRFVLISTDKAVNPTNVMGATKRTCEMIIQSINEISSTEFVAVRFGNVLGSNGSVVPLFKKQIDSGGPVTLTHKEITRFFMTIPEAASLVIQAGAFAHGGEIFVLDMGEPVKIYDLAVNLITLSGYIPGEEIPIKITGLRKGEKLYEELLMSEEGLESTKHEKIFVAKPMHFEWDVLNEKLEKLKVTAQELNDEKLVAELKKLVPTFREDDTDKECEDKGKTLECVS